MATRPSNSKRVSTRSLLPSLDDFLLFIQANNYSHNTLINYERDLKTFEFFLDRELDSLPFSSVSKRTIEQYKAYLHSSDRKTAGGADTAVSLNVGSINRSL